MRDAIYYCVFDREGHPLDEFGGTGFAPCLFKSREQAQEYADDPGDNYVVCAVRLEEIPDA